MKQATDDGGRPPVGGVGGALEEAFDPTRGAGQAKGLDARHVRRIVACCSVRNRPPSTPDRPWCKLRNDSQLPFSGVDRCRSPPISSRTR